MTWIGNDATSFNGLEQHRAKPRAYIFEEDVEAVISDTALVYQFLRNKDLTPAWSGKVCAGTAANGHVYRATDFGDTWADEGQLGAETYVFSFCYCGDGIVLAGTSPSAAVYRSTDYGDTWALADTLGSESHVLSMVYLGSGVVLAGTYTTGQIYKSTDWGQNFSLVQQLGAEIAVWSLASFNSGIVCAGTESNGKVYRSTDYGDTWTDRGQLGAETQVLAIEYCGAGVGVAGTGYGGKVYRSTDYGDTWGLIQQLGAETGVFSFAYCGNGILTAGTAPTGKIFRSTNKGSAWTDKGQLGAQIYIFSQAYLGDGIITCGTGLGGKVFRSQDYGQTWADEGQLGAETQIWGMGALDAYNPDAADDHWSGSSGSGMPGYQNHSGGGRGCLLGWPLCSINFGKGVTAGGSWHGSVRYPTIDASQASAGTEYKHLLRWPVFIPSGVDRVVMHVRAAPDFWELAPAAVRYTAVFASGADVGTLELEGEPARFYDHRDGSEKSFFFEMPIDAAGDLYVLGLDIDLGATDARVQLYSIRVLPVVWQAVAASPDDEWGVGTRSSNYQAPTAASFPRISDAHTAAGRSLNALVVSKAAEAHSYTFELLTDTSLDGETPTVNGHDHDGMDSETIELGLQSSCLGWHQTGVAGPEGLTSTEGDSGRAPVIGATGLYSGNQDDMALTALCVPRIAYSTTRELNWAAVVYNDATSCSVRAETSDAVTDSPFDNLGDFVQGTSASSEWTVHKGTVDAIDGALNWAKFRAFCSKSCGCTFTGFCFWVT